MKEKMNACPIYCYFMYSFFVRYSNVVWWLLFKTQKRVYSSKLLKMVIFLFITNSWPLMFLLFFYSWTPHELLILLFPLFSLLMNPHVLLILKFPLFFLLMNLSCVTNSQISTLFLTHEPSWVKKSLFSPVS